MLFDNYLSSRIRNIWLKYNLQYLLVGIIIGTFINVIFQLVDYDSSRSWKNFTMTYIVSILITLSITNISIISECIIRIKFKSPLVNILLTYLIMIAGVVVGTEISFLFASAIYNRPFNEFDQLGSLQFNLTLGFIAGTIIYLYQLQRDNYQLKIRDQELMMSKLKELKTQADLKTLQARINPHFLYNSLNSITSLIHDEPDKAEEMTINLSRLFRYTINKQDADFATVSEEIEIMNTYLDIERVRFGDRIIFTVDADEAVRNMLIPRFLLQPLVENALKHGLKDKSSDGTLKVGIRQQEDRLLITVMDNGLPFPDDLMPGYGLQSTYDKLKLLYEDNWELNYQNTPVKQLTIKIPLRNSL
jgi:two-component system, LytTR family, sensor kinase